MNYLTITDVRIKPIFDKVEQAEWTDNDIIRSIEEAENYVETNLVRLGYTREQLLAAPLVKKLMVNYCWYVILRDIYTMQSPSVGSGQEFKKWKDDVDDILKKIEERKIRLTNERGEIIEPASVLYDIRTTTSDVKRAVHMGKDWEWSIDDKYSKEEITNIEK